MAIVIDPLRSCLATNTESDRDCDPDSDADTDSGSSTAVFMHVGAHRAHELLLRKQNYDNSPSGSESVSGSQPQLAIVIDPLRSCLATKTENDRGCDPDSDADTDSGSSTAIFLHMGAHPAHELLSPDSVTESHP